MPQMDVVFGVKGNGSATGESGKRIAGQLRQIANEISKNDSIMPKVIIGVNAKNTRTQIQQQLDKIAQGLTIKIGSSVGGGGSGGKGGLSDLERQARNINTLINKNALGSEAVNKKKFAALDTSQWSTYESQLKEVLDLQSKVFETQADGSVKRIGSDSQLTDFINKYEQLKNLLDNVTTAQQKNNKTIEQQALVQQKVIDEITTYQQKYKATLVNAPTQAAQLNTLLGQVQDGSYFKTGDATKLNSEVKRLKNEIRLAGGETENLRQKLERLFDDHFWAGAVTAITDGLRRAPLEIFKQVINNIKELDKAVVDLQIATGGTREETKQLVREYSDLARELGTTTAQIAQAADSWLRQGYEMEEANELIKQSTMLSKLGQMSASEATTGLTATLKGYKMEASEAASVVDMLTAVDLEAAASAGDIMTALQECANSARISGIEIETLVGYLTTLKDVTQLDSSRIGTFAKSMLARMGNIKAGRLEDPETGESLKSWALVA